MSSQRNSTLSPSPTEHVPSIGNPSSDPLSLPNNPSAGTSSRGPDKDLDIKNTRQVLPKKLEEGQAEYAGKSYERTITISMLPDDVLLQIFDSFRKGHNPDNSHFVPVWMWHILVQVCQRWRQLIFASPRRLDLQLLCTNGTPVLENLDCWPPFPIAIHYPNYRHCTPDDEENIFTLLNQPGRIRHIDLTLTGPQITAVATAMQRPFPALTHLILQWTDERPAALPSGFLGGSAPCLQYMHLDGIVFPALFTFLSSTSDLVSLFFRDIPHISPEAMVACLAVLPRLNSLDIGFQSTSFDPDRMPPPSAIRASLPSLTSFQFEGNDVYLEDLVARIDSPQLNQINVKYLNQLVHFQVTQLFQFIDRSKDPRVGQITHADVNFSHLWVTFEMYPHLERRPGWGPVSCVIHGQLTRIQVSEIAQVFNQPSAMLSRVAHLKLYRSQPAADCPPDDWMHLFRQFSAIRTLHVSREFSRHVSSVLEGVTGELVAEVLPVLDFIYLDALPISCVKKFLAARQISGRPVTIIDTEAEFDERVKSYVE
ncbi:hypothetical protein V8E53_007575 [Lactarius tabidus]